MRIPVSLAIYALAALAEIAGSFSFWAWLRLGRSPLWMVPGAAFLLLFAFLLTRVDLSFAGRTYAAYGGIYIIASLVWLWLIEGQTPGLLDLAGGGLCLAGAVTILSTPFAQS